MKGKIDGYKQAADAAASTAGEYKSQLEEVNWRLASLGKQLKC